MNASVDDRGSKGDCTPLMEASSGGYIDIVRLLLEHTADVNSQSQAGNTALIYACCGGYEDVVEVLLNHGADIEAHNENGHTPLMEAASGGHVSVAKMLLERGACINSHSNEFKESALTLACYKGKGMDELEQHFLNNNFAGKVYLCLILILFQALFVCFLDVLLDVPQGQQIHS